MRVFQTRRRGFNPLFPLRKQDDDPPVPLHTLTLVRYRPDEEPEVQIRGQIIPEPERGLSEMSLTRKAEVKAWQPERRQPERGIAEVSLSVS